VKIAICHYSCPPVIGGVQTIVEQQARLLKRHNHYTKVIAGSGGKFSQYIDVDINPMIGSGIMETYEHESGHDMTKLMEPQIYSILGFLEYSLASFDILIVHNVLSMPFNLPLTHAIHRMAENGKIKVISWNHDSPFFNRRNGDECPPSWDILKQASPHVRYVSISQARKLDFEKLYGGGREVKVIPNGLSISNFLKLQDITNQLIEDKKLYEADLILLQPGRFHAGKNVEYSIKVVKALLNRGIHAVIMFTAAIDPHDSVSMDYHNHVKQAVSQEGIEDHVIFISDYVYRIMSTPNIDRSILRDLYNVADMLFIPNSHEGYGITLLEAALARLPIACSDIPLFREVCDGNSCVFSLEETPEQVAERIESFAAHGPIRMFKRVFKEYSWENIYQEKILPLLRETEAGSG